METILLILGIITGFSCGLYYSKQQPRVIVVPKIDVLEIIKTKHFLNKDCKAVGFHDDGCDFLIKKHDK